ncbi:hypothetical protein OG912_05155 [Streptomyces sp. NBC_00464]|uniref:hypothetical protein n=1 Tax=Streptomyces sp. NBC_00464 TaxID=2975751 RepID=UPI002E17547F
MDLTSHVAPSAAMGELTRKPAPGLVSVRLRGLAPGFVVTLPADGTTPGSIDIRRTDA